MESKAMPNVILRSTHTGILKIGDLELECHVLEDSRRIFSTGDLLKVFNLQIDQKSQPRILASFLHKIKVNSLGNNDLTSPLTIPIKFTRSGRGGIPTNGYLAELLPAMCDAVLKMQTDRWLPENMRDAAKRSRMLMTSFAKVGLIALIDEATGYQEVRDKDALQKILDKYLRKEWAEWAKRFPDEFYKELFRLKGWEWRGMKVNRPSVVGTYTKDIVYKRLAPGILEELESRNPLLESGQRKVRHHQWLTDDVGHPALTQHIYGVTVLMKSCIDWSQFNRALTRVYPMIGEQKWLELEESEA
jgi:hypothetical protein